ncbi:putative branched-subunit amino acid permease [Haloactinopolyspora alba]|uniref:Putative branched-subunit amino acid permease n=1 Tax=Haloactinopolyspora alba TaxID=648780 RepID=A0A2P8DV73_9ACTN|nr:AzlC family ABC transporter permease [Haloactinopolyspora alba]PSL01112.1 putative branched-subunit amino acid permease [Haloactinopolyspora alba]
MTTVSAVSPDTHKAIRRDALGIAAYAGAFGASFGAVSIASGLSVAQTVVLSVVMFSGASQFALVGVIGGGGAGLAAIPTALLLGVRNAFYGVPMARILGREGLRGLRRPVAAHLVIDETTAMAVAREDPEAQRYAFWTTGVLLFTFWNTGTAAGALASSRIGDVGALGLDAMAPAAFLALLWPRLRVPAARWVAAAGALIATALVPLVPAGLPVLATAPVAVVAGLLPRRRTEEAP